jgi:glucose/arabinose dehydrogenase
MIVRHFLVIWTLWLTGAHAALSQTLPANFAREPVATGISSPTVFAFAPDGRIFVAQQNGVLRVIKNGALLPTPFISIAVNSTGERGLIGIALDPDFNVNAYIYLYYTVNTTPLHNRVVRYTANGDVAMAGSEQVILVLDNLSTATNHNGGALAFGADGKLYIAVGDNANINTPQNLDTYHGKMLRINKDGSAPTDNPFYAAGASEQRKRIWAYGLRNPYTFSIGMGRIYVSDVGQNTYEEINDATVGGRNFGWPATEGPTTNPSYTSPVYAYHHTIGTPTGCAITGGSFFANAATNYPAEYQNKFYFQDYCQNWIYYINPDQANPTPQFFASNIGGTSLSIQTGPDGNLYYLSRGAAALYRIVFNPPAVAPVITQQPASQTITEGQTASFSVTATGTTPLSYQWQKDGVNINGATSPAFQITSTAIAAAGNYRVIVSNTVGSATSNNALLTVNPNVPSLPAILQPPQSITTTVGQHITFSVLVAGSAPFTYQWQKNQVDIGGATQPSFALPAVNFNDAGNYRVLVRNAIGSALSSEATLAVQNRLPVIAIALPVKNSFYSAGDKIEFAATATDPDQGALPANAFQWQINFHHDTHYHDQPAIEGVAAGFFDVPREGEVSANVWYRFIVTATDNQGAKVKDSVDVVPRKARLTFATEPTGLTLLLDGQPALTPFATEGVHGILRQLQAPESQKQNEQEYVFQRWEHGGSILQNIITPAANTTYTARYAVVTAAIDKTNAIHPIPASHTLFIPCDASVTTCTDLLGRKYPLTATRRGENTEVDVGPLPDGIYLLTYQKGHAVHQHKVVIKK